MFDKLAILGLLDEGLTPARGGGIRRGGVQARYGEINKGHLIRNSGQSHPHRGPRDLGWYPHTVVMMYQPGAAINNDTPKPQATAGGKHIFTAKKKKKKKIAPAFGYPPTS